MSPAEPVSGVPVRMAMWPWLGLAVLFAAAFGPVLASIAGSWFDPTANMEHGLLVPGVAGYAVYQNWRRLQSLPMRPRAWGLGMIAGAAILVWVSTVAQWTYLARISVLISIAGGVIFLHGPLLLRALRYPFLILFMGITPPTFIYSRLTLELQLIASILAEKTLEVIGYSVLRQGNILEMVGEKLAVEEACSGIKSLITLGFFALVYVYFLVPEKRIRVCLLASVVPIAIAGNAMRIVITGVVGQYDRQLAHSVFHDISGYVLLLFSSAVFLSVHWLAGRFGSPRRLPVESRV